MLSSYVQSIATNNLKYSPREQVFVETLVVAAACALLKQVGLLG